MYELFVESIADDVEMIVLISFSTSFVGELKLCFRCVFIVVNFDSVLVDSSSTEFDLSSSEIVLRSSLVVLYIQPTSEVEQADQNSPSHRKFSPSVSFGHKRSGSKMPLLMSVLC